MAAHWAADQKKDWEERRKAACRKFLMLADQALGRLRNRKHLKILESGRNKLMT
jgi:hypothetical protein